MVDLRVYEEIMSGYKNDFEGTDLRDADFSGADLKFANLSGVILGSANLREAILFNANLSDKNLREAELRGATLDVKIFVFGSNLRGIHSAGQALYARQHHGAIMGQGIGAQGSSYAIPTKRSLYEKMPLSEVREHVLKFLTIARRYPELTFEVQRIGCGSAGFTDDDMKPLFEHSPENVHLHFR